MVTLHPPDAVTDLDAQNSHQHSHLRQSSHQLDGHQSDSHQSDSHQSNSHQSNSGQSDSHPLSNLIVLSGPSGVGKGTLLKQLIQRHPEIQVSVSATTRSPRTGEIEGQHYFFVSKSQFGEMVENGDLLEWAEFAGNCYGTPKAPIKDAIAHGHRVILEIELMGARQVRKNFPAAKQIFVMPPSASTLEERIRSRGQDSEAAIAKRLAQAKIELAAVDEFDVKIVNSDLETAIAELESAIFTT